MLCLGQRPALGTWRDLGLGDKHKLLDSMSGNFLCLLTVEEQV